MCFPKLRTDGALQCRHAVVIVSCCLEFEPYGGVDLFVVLHNPLLYGFLLYGTFLVGRSLHGVSRSITELSKLRFLCADILPEQKTIDRILLGIDGKLSSPNVISTTACTLED